jgi:hypothetical protein
VAVVDLGQSIQGLFQSQALGIRNKIDLATAQAKGTAVTGIVGYYVGTGIITAAAFSVILGLGLMVGQAMSTQYSQGVGLVSVGGFIVVGLGLGALLISNSIKARDRAFGKSGREPMV